LDWQIKFTYFTQPDPPAVIVRRPLAAGNRAEGREGQMECTAANDCWVYSVIFPRDRIVRTASRAPPFVVRWLALTPQFIFICYVATILVILTYQKCKNKYILNN